MFRLCVEQLRNFSAVFMTRMLLRYEMNLAVTTWQAPIRLNDILSLCADIYFWSKQREYLAENSRRSVNFCYHQVIRMYRKSSSVFYITNEMQLIQCSLLLSALYMFRA
jgi:hypothetical protein